MASDDARRVRLQGPKALSTQLLTTSSVRLPVGLVQAHMPEVAALDINSSHAIALQMVLLPPRASDVTAATPAQDVIDIPHDVTVTNYSSSSKQSKTCYTLAGHRPHVAAQVKARWYARCFRVLGPWHIQLLCSPRLPADVEAAKQQQQERSRRLKLQRALQLQQGPTQQREHHLPASTASDPQRMSHTAAAATAQAPVLSAEANELAAASAAAAASSGLASGPFAAAEPATAGQAATLKQEQAKPDTHAAATVAGVTAYIGSCSSAQVLLNNSSQAADPHAHQANNPAHGIAFDGRRTTWAERKKHREQQLAARKHQHAQQQECVEPLQLLQEKQQQGQQPAAGLQLAESTKRSSSLPAVRMLVNREHKQQQPQQHVIANRRGDDSRGRRHSRSHSPLQHRRSYYSRSPVQQKHGIAREQCGSGNRSRSRSRARSRRSIYDLPHHHRHNSCSRRSGMSRSRSPLPRYDRISHSRGRDRSRSRSGAPHDRRGRVECGSLSRGLHGSRSRSPLPHLGHDSYSRGSGRSYSRSRHQDRNRLAPGQSRSRSPLLRQGRHNSRSRHQDSSRSKGHDGSRSRARSRSRRDAPHWQHSHNSRSRSRRSSSSRRLDISCSKTPVRSWQPYQHPQQPCNINFPNKDRHMEAGATLNQPQAKHQQDQQHCQSGLPRPQVKKDAQPQKQHAAGQQRSYLHQHRAEQQQQQQQLQLLLSPSTPRQPHLQQQQQQQQRSDPKPAADELDCSAHDMPGSQAAAAAAAAAAPGSSRGNSTCSQGPFNAAAAASLADLDIRQLLEPQLSRRQSMVAAASAAAAVVDANDATEQAWRPLQCSIAAARAASPAAAVSAVMLAVGSSRNSNTQLPCNPLAARQSVDLNYAAPPAAEAATQAAAAVAAAAGAAAGQSANIINVEGPGPGYLNNRTLSRCYSLPSSSQPAGCSEMPVAELLQQLGLQQFAGVFEQQMIFSANLVAKMERQDFVDIGVPKGAALVIIERCRQLLQG